MDDDGWAAAGRDESHELIIEVYEKNREKRGREGAKGLYASGCVCVRERERERERRIECAVPTGFLMCMQQCDDGDDTRYSWC